jgi:hypothetical protein
VLPSGEWHHKVKIECTKPILTLFEMKQYIHDRYTDIDNTHRSSLVADPVEVSP